MRDRRTDLADCCALVSAEQTRAKAGHRDAVRIESEAQATQQAADAEVEAAVAAWRERVTRGVDPALCALYGQQLVERVANVDASRSTLVDATQRREDAASDWRQRHTELSGVEQLLADERRRFARRRDERALARIADRTAYAWSRP